MPALIEMENIQKAYRSGRRQVEALRGVSLQIQRGEFAAIIGSSGSGKSTLMNILGCLDLPDAGRYLLDGVEIFSQPEKALCRIRSREIGFVFQSFHLIPTLNALENVELPLLYQGVGAAARRQRAAELLKRVGLEGRFSHRPKELSGGQQQRVAIARALAADPSLILADEPTGNLDSASGGEIMGLLEDLNRRGKTVVLITHDPSVAARAGRVIRIRDGRAEEELPPKGLFGGENPPPGGEKGPF